MRSHRKKYRVKFRFYLWMILIVCVGAAALWHFAVSPLLSGSGSSTGRETVQERAQGWEIMMAAKKYIHNEELRYNGAYFNGGYPPDNIGVCTDVIWQGLKGIDVVLKDLVDADIAAHPEAYKEVMSAPDPNIDFRYVPTLEVFLQRNAKVLTTDVDDKFAWMPGDIVTFESSHVAVVSNLKNIWGRPFIIQHGHDPAAEEDRIFATDGMKISGHFRWPLLK